MKLSGAIIISLSIVLFVIGVHQLMLFGLMASYWIFMLSVSLLLLYKVKAKGTPPEEKKPPVKKGKKRGMKK